VAQADPGMLTDWYSNYMKSQPKAETYTPTSAAASVWTPDENSTVQGQLTKVLDKGGPLMQRATTRAAQQMNSRGLLNSSIAVGAGQSALYDAATPIAATDAGTFASAGKTNAELGTQTSIANAGYANDAGRFSADARNQAIAQQRSAGIQGEQTAQQRAEQALGRSFTTSERLGTQGFQAGESALDREQKGMLQSAEFKQQTALQQTDLASKLDQQIRQIQAEAESQGRTLTFQEQQQLRDLQNQREMQGAGFKQQTALQDADFAQQSKTQAADLASRYDLANMDVASRERLQQADIANQQKLQAANATLQTGLQATDNAVKQSMQQYDAVLKQSMQGLDNENKLKLATMDAENRTALAKLEAEYKNQLQANSSMATSYQSMVDSFTRVMLDPNMDASAKQSAIGSLTTLYNNTLKMQSDVSGLKLGELLAPGTITAPAGAPAPAPAQAAPGGRQNQDPWLARVDGGGP